MCFRKKENGNNGLLIAQKGEGKRKGWNGGQTEEEEGGREEKGK